MKFRCPDSVSGVCTETRCGGYLVNPRQDGFDDNMNPLYTAACVFDGSVNYFNGLRPESYADYVERDKGQQTESVCQTKREKTRKPKGRPISDDRRNMVVEAIKWLKRNPDRSAPEAADHVYETKEILQKWPAGYERPKDIQKSADDPFVRAINRARAKAKPKK